MGVTAADLKRAGFSDEVIENYIKDKSESLLNAGFDSYTVNKTFGIEESPTSYEFEQQTKRDINDDNTEAAVYNPDGTIKKETKLYKQGFLASSDMGKIDNIQESKPQIYDTTVDRLLGEKTDKGVELPTNIKNSEEYDLVLAKQDQTRKWQIDAEKAGVRFRADAEGKVFHDQLTDEQINYFWNDPDSDRKSVIIDGKRVEIEYRKPNEIDPNAPNLTKILDVSTTAKDATNEVINSNVLKNKITKEGINNLNLILSVISGIESGNRNIESFLKEEAIPIKNRRGAIIGSKQPDKKYGLFQIDSGEIVDLLNEFSNIYTYQYKNYEMPERFKAAYNHKDATKLLPDDQRALATIKFLKNLNKEELDAILTKNNIPAIKNAIKKYNPNINNERLDEYMNGWSGMLFDYENPQLATWKSDGNFLPEKIVRMTGGRGEYNVFSRGVNTSFSGMLYNMTFQHDEYGYSWEEAYRASMMYDTANFGQEIIGLATNVAADIPFYGLGYIGGVGKGLAFSPKVRHMITPMLGWGGAFALPATGRDIYTRALWKNEVVNFNQIKDQIFKAETAKVYGKNWTIGAATGAVNRFVQPRFGGVASFNAEIATMTAVESILDGVVPTKQDFVVAGTLIGGVYGGRGLFRKLLHIYAKYGITPQKMKTLADENPEVKSDLLDPDIVEPQFLIDINKIYEDDLAKELNIKFTKGHKVEEGQTAIFGIYRTKGTVVEIKQSDQGENFYKIKQPNGQTVIMREMDVEPANNIDYNIEATPDGKFVISEKTLDDFDVRQTDGQYNKDLKEIKSRNTKKFYNENNIIDFTEGNIISGGNLIGTSAFFIKKSILTFTSIIEKLPKVKKQYKTAKDFISDNFGSMSIRKGVEVDEVIEIKKNPKNGLSFDGIILRSSKNEKFIVPNDLYQLLKNVNNVQFLYANKILVAIDKTTRQVIGAIRTKKPSATISQQSDTYYNLHIPNTDKKFANSNRKGLNSDKEHLGDDPAPDSQGISQIPVTDEVFRKWYQALEPLDSFTLVELIKSATKQNPQLKNIINNNPDVLGAFYRGIIDSDGKVIRNPEVQIKKALQENPEEFVKTMAHEIGHLIDYLDGSTINPMKGKSSKFFQPKYDETNLLGKLANLKKYMNEFIGKGPDSPAALNPEQIAKIKLDAEFAARAEFSKNTKRLLNEYDVTPEKIVKLVNAPEGLKISEEFLDVFLRLDKSLQVQIYRAAMKSTIDPYIQPIVNKVNNVVDEQMTPEMIQRAEIVFAKKIEAEIRERGLISLEEVTKELVRLTEVVRPYNKETAPLKFRRYRENTNEIIADFMMSFLLNPQFTAMHAPKATQLFYSYMSKRPIVRETLESLQGSLNAGGSSTRHANVITGLVNSFAKNKTENIEAFKKNKYMQNNVDMVYTENIDYMGYFYRRMGVGVDDPDLKKTKWRNNLTLDTNASLEKLRYGSAAQDQYIKRMKDVIIQIENAAPNGYNTNELEAMMVLRNLATSTQRSGVANMKGIFAAIEKDMAGNPVFAKYGINVTNAADVYKQYAKDNPILDEAVTKIFKIREESVFPVLRESRAFTDEQLKAFTDNVSYIKYNQKKYALERLEKTSMLSTGAFNKQTVGSLEDITSPLISTIQNDLLMMSNLRHNRAVHDLVLWLQQNKKDLEVFDAERVRKKTGYNGWKDVVIKAVPTAGGKPLTSRVPQGMKLVHFIQNGKTKYFYINKFAEMAIRRNPYETSFSLAFMNDINNVWKGIFTNYNPFFLVNNELRDYRKTLRNSVAGLGPLKLLMYQFKSTVPAWKSVFGDGTELTRKMERDGYFIGVSEGYHTTAGLKRIQKLSDEGVIDAATEEFELILQRNTFTQNAKLIGKLKGILNKVGQFANFRERAGKLAPVLYYMDQIKKGKIKMSDNELMLRTQSEFGSPAFLRKGRKSPDYEQVLFYYNPFKEGLRADYSRFMEDPLLVTSQAMLYETLPMIYNKAVKYGLLGEDMARNFSGVSEYDEKNFTIIQLPAFTTESGKSVYLRIPLDETSRAYNGMLGSVIDVAMGDADITEIADFAGERFTLTTAPLLKLFSMAFAFATGKNYYDQFWQEFSLDDNVYKAQDMNTVKAAIKKFIETNFGYIGTGLNKYVLSGDTPEEIKDEIEEYLGMPIVGGLANVIIRVGDPALNEAYDAKKQYTKDKARETVEYRNIVNKYINQETLTAEEMDILMQDNAKKLLNNSSFRNHAITANGGDDLVQLMDNAKTKEEKFYILQQLLDTELITLEKANDLFNMNIFDSSTIPN